MGIFPILKAVKLGRHKNKKAQVARMLLELGGLFLAVVVFFAFVDFGGKMLGIFLKDPKIEQARGNFNALVTYVNEAMEEDDEFAARFGKPITIPEQFAIIGFDREYNNLQATTTCYGNTNDNVDLIGGTYLKPTACGNKACLVLFSKNIVTPWDKGVRSEGGDWDSIQALTDEAVVAYVTFDDVEQFSGTAEKDSVLFDNWGKMKPDDDQFYHYLDLPNEGSDEFNDLYASEYLMLFGECWPREGTRWGVRNVYVEKFTATTPSGDKHTQIYIAKESDTTTRRYSEINARMDFKEYIEAQNYCEASEGDIWWSRNEPHYNERLCQCGYANINLPPGYIIKIENGWARLYLQANPENPDDLTEIMNEPLTVPMLGKAKNRIIIIGDQPKLELEGYHSLHMHRVDGSIVASDNSLSVSEQCTLRKEAEQMAIRTYHSFEDAIGYYYPANFKLPDDAPADYPCIMGRSAFEVLQSLDKEYNLLLNEDGQREIKLKDDEDNVIKSDKSVLPNSPCVIDSSLALSNVDMFHSFGVYTDDTSLTGFPTFFLKDGRSCFELIGASDGSGTWIRDSLGQELPVCNYRQINPKMAERLELIITKLNECQGAAFGDCSDDMEAINAPGYAIMLEQLEGVNEIRIGLHLNGFAVDERIIHGSVCSGQPLKADIVTLPSSSSYIMRKTIDEGICFNSLN